MKKTVIQVSHTSHLDLYWWGSQADCLEKGNKIITDAINYALEDDNFHFVIESVRFAEYFVKKNPDKVDTLKKLIATGQFEIAACYSDRNEHYHDGEAYVRNIEYGRRLLKKLLDYDSLFAFHPDALGISEQTPQIHKKCGAPVYFQSRGGHGNGARFNWAGLDGTTVLYYDYPASYGYYNFDGAVANKIPDIQKNIGMDDILILCSAGDCGGAGTFVTRFEKSDETYGRFLKDGKDYIHVDLRDFLGEASRKHDFDIKYVSPCRTLLSLDNSNLPTYSGEGPNRRGAVCSTTMVNFIKLDKTVSAVLCDGEKMFAIAKALGIDTSERIKKEFKSAFGTFSGGRRKYFDKEFFDGKGEDYTVNDLFDLGWRLHTTTQDHNYAGVEAAQMIFDRNMYQKTCLRLGNSAIKACLAELGKRVEGDKGDMIVFNTLNWGRGNLAAVPEDIIDPTKSYMAVCGEDNKKPVVNISGQYMFGTVGTPVPSVGYKVFKIVEADKKFARTASDLKYKNNRIVAANKFYSVTLNRVNGILENVTDLETGMSVSGSFLHARMYEENAKGSGEKTVDWKFLDDASEHVSSVMVTEDNYYITKLTVETVLYNSFLRIDIVLHNHEKKIELKPTLYSYGPEETRASISLPFSPEMKDITYGVPYGAQKFGTPLIPCSGEIAEELYKRYRDIVYWMVMEGGGKGLSISTTHNSMDIKENSMDAILYRNVRSSMDPAFCYTNPGALAWNFTISSYTGTWEDNKVWRTSHEMLHPYYTAVLEETGDASLPAEKSLIDTDEAGVVSVFKVSDYDSGTYTMRVFNPCPTAAPLKITDPAGGGEWECRNIDETPCADPVDRLGAYEIKTLVKKI